MEVVGMPDKYIGVDSEYRSLRNGVGLLDHSDLGKYFVSGEGATQFLNELSSRDIEFLIEERTAVSLMLRPDATVIAEVSIHNLGDDGYLVEVWPPQAEAAWSHLNDYAAQRPDVELEDKTADFRVFAIEGPRSFHIAQTLIEFPIAVVSYRGIVRTEWQGEQILLSRTGLTGEYGYRLYAPHSLADSLRNHLLASDAQLCGLEALDVCRMESRFVNMENEISANSFYPFDLGIHWMVDFNKDEFLGREALISYKEQGLMEGLVCFSLKNGIDPVERGSGVYAGDERVGTVNHSLYSPGLNLTIGVARVHRDFVASGLDLEIRMDASAKMIRTVSAPFVVPRSFSTPMTHPERR